MAFNPLYASDPRRNPAVDNAFTPGRPVNLRRDIGTALGQMPLPPEAPQVEAPSFSLPGEGSIRDRATGAASAIANSIPADTPSAFGQFAGGMARGFAGVQAYLQAITGQRTEQAEGNTDRELNRERLRATTAAEQARGRSEDAQADRWRQPASVPTPAADSWEEVRNQPAGSPRLQINRRTGETKPVLDPSGRPLRVTAPPAPANLPRAQGESDADWWDRMTAKGINADAATAYIRAHQ